MPSFFSNDFFLKYRKRKRIAQAELLKREIEDRDDISQISIMRIEEKKHKPSSKSIKALAEAMELPFDTLLIPYFENQTSHMLQQRDQLQYYLLYATNHDIAYQKATEIILELEHADDFAQGVNRQFLLSCKAIAREISEADPKETMQLIIDAVAITYPEYDEATFDDDALIFYEANLLLTKAQTYKRIGQLQTAIDLLMRILEGLDRLPQDERDKEQQLVPVLLTLAQCQIHNGDYKLALETCQIGYDTSMKRNKGFYLPDFAHIKALCMVSLGQKDNATPLLKQAYFGYSLLRRNKNASDLLQFAKDNLNIIIETYGVDTMQLPLPEPDIAHGNAKKFETFGELLNDFRLDADLTYDSLCEGICGKTTLENIIKGKQQGNPMVLEALMQRLGRDIDKYINTFLGEEEFYNKQKRDKANALIANKKFAEGEKLINELATDKAFAQRIGEQFIKLSRVIINERHLSNDTAHFEELLDVVRVTNKKFDLRQVATTRLTYYEVVAVNMMAIYLCNNKKSRHKGLHLYDDLIASMDKYYVDDVAKMRMYPTVLNNYTTTLETIGQYDDALPIIDAGEVFSIVHKQFKKLPGFAFNKSWGLLETGRKEEGLPYLALSYYGDALMENPLLADITSSYAKDHFDIEFN